MRRSKTNRIIALFMAMAMMLTLFPAAKAIGAETLGRGPIVIYEAYGGGGNNGGVYKNDFIVLKNISTADVDVTGWTVQYASATGTFNSQVGLSGIIPAGGYVLIQAAEGSNKDQQELPPPDYVTSIAMGASNFKLLLSRNAVPVASSAMPSTLLETYPIVDYLGAGTATAYLGAGAAPAGSNGTSIIRNTALADPYTGDNKADFTTHTPDLS